MAFDTELSRTKRSDPDMTFRAHETGTALTPDQTAPEQYAVVNGWLVELVDKCTCGAGPGTYGWMHEPGCGMVPVDTIENLLRQPPRLDADQAATAIFEALGTASVCWGEPGPGPSIFQSEKAAKVGRDLLTALGYPIPAGYRDRTQAGA